MVKDLLNLIFSNDCIVCGQRSISSEIPLCRECMNKLIFPSGICHICGRVSNGLCKDCIDGLFDFDYARSVLLYNDISARIIKKFKYNGNIKLSLFIASYMYRVIINDNTLSSVEYITYIPFNYIKRFNRFYNHSHILASLLSEMTGIPIVENLIKAKVSLLNEAKLNKTFRRKRGILFKKGNNSIHANSVLIIDDVITTGKTLSDASLIIKKYNSINKIYCLTFASD